MVLTRSRIADHNAIAGNNTDVYVYLSPFGIKPTADQTLTAATGGAAKGATSITITTGLTNKLYKGQALCFYNATTGQETLAILTADANAAATTLTVEELAKAIAAGATAEIPAYVWDRSGADLSQESEFSAVSGYNDSRAGQNGTISGGSASFSIPGRYHYENAGGRTLAYAQKNGLKVYVKRFLDKPSDAYLTGPGEEFFAFVTSRSSASPNDENVSEEFELTIVGTVTEIPPEPV